MEEKQYSQNQCQIQTFKGVADDAKVAMARTEQPGDENVGFSIQEGIHTSDAKLELPCEKTTSQAKSSSTRFLVITQSSAAESFDEIGSVSIGVSKNDIDLSILHHKPEAPFSSYGSTPPITGDDPTSQSQLEESESESESESCTWKKLWFEPTLPICLKFEDVTYKVPVKGDENKYILHGITGLVHPGEVLALMGPSGGGKTTLLNLLSGRVKFHSGTITYNNQPYSNSLRWRIGFVLQDDVAFPHLTVKETLTYAALLRLPNTLTMQQKKERATSVISELGLVR
ncbi:hypothetical protein V6N13_009194 [Hibiscus sabdariffa]